MQTALDSKPSSGYRVSLLYQPKYFIQPWIQLYFDASFGRWLQNEMIYSTAPIFRFYIQKTNLFSPFVELSIGFAYLSKTRLDHQNLGIHFAFQDQVGLGITYGSEQHLYTLFSILHYSNGSLSANNSGMTIPLTLTIGYRF